MYDKALVIFSGGQDSTTCLIQAIHLYGKENVEAITFNYGQRHDIEVKKAEAIANDLGVNHVIVNTLALTQTTHNALMDDQMAIESSSEDAYPNTFVDGRNALFLLLAANYAKNKQIHQIILGVSEADYSGYPDCRDIFIKSMNVSLNLALDYPFFIKTPLMFIDKAATWQLADELGYLHYVQTRTHTCYVGVDGGCHECPSCKLREEGLVRYLAQRVK